MFPSRAHRPHHGCVVKGIVRVAMLSASIAAASPALFAGQAVYTVGVTADLTGGVTGPNTGNNFSPTADGYVPFYGTYPSIAFQAREEHTTLNASYAFGYNRDLSDPVYETKSHAVNVSFSASLGPKWNLNLGESYSMTSDVSTFRFLSESESNPDQFQYVFTPVFGQANLSNTVSVGANRMINTRSHLTFSGSFSRLDYPENVATSGILSDQKRISGSFTYTYTGERNSWSIGYSVARMNFVKFNNSLNNSAILGYSHQLSPALTFRIDVGPSYLESLESEKSPVGVNVTVSVTRIVQKGSLSFSFTQTGGDTSGLGSVAKSRDAAFAFNRRLGKNTSLTVNASGFDSQGLQVTPVSARGGSAGASVGYSLGQMWSLSWGGQYQHYEGYNTSGYDQNRLFMSLRYGNPKLWRF